ncbi:MAG: hypothetical protein ACXVJ0_09780, partial [Candidatus Angelobacter sp.]
MAVQRFPVLLALMVLVAPAGAQSGSAKTLAGTANALQSAPIPVRLENGSILYAELLKTVDAKKAKVGDPVT